MSGKTQKLLFAIFALVSLTSTIIFRTNFKVTAAIVTAITLLILRYFLLKKTNLMLLVIFSFFVYSTLATAQMLVRDYVYGKKCFKVNVSYPGKTEYENCVRNLTLMDYYLTITSK